MTHSLMRAMARQRHSADSTISLTLLAPRLVVPILSPVPVTEMIVNILLRPSLTC